MNACGLVFCADLYYITLRWVCSFGLKRVQISLILQTNKELLLYYSLVNVKEKTISQGPTKSCLSGIKI